ncbi:MAG: type II/IV secretion system protein, partial [Planctomycetes bacterium]|nr:type II/IV secretion system protein [Planctomycetota bacterium]
MKTKDPVLDLLEKEKMLDESVLAEVLKEHEASGLSILNILKNENHVSEDDMPRLVAASNQIEFLTLSPDAIDNVVAHLVSYEMANRHTLIPVRREENKLVLAMASPMNLVIRDQIEMKTGYKIVPVAATPSAIRQAIHFHFDVASVTKQAIASMRLKADQQEEVDKPEKETSQRVLDDPITKLVASIIRGAIDAGSSDIHIEPQEADVRVRYRVDGLLRSAITVPASAKDEVVSHIKIMADMDISEKRIPQDGHMSVRHSGKEYDLRISSLPAVGGEKIVIRILDKSANKWNLDDVVTDPHDNRRLRELVDNPYGLILVTGPTGCGKTTTLYSLLQLVNTPERNIVTVEDPVEYSLDGITQVQVRPAAGMTFGAALRSILRQDPDIILVGEIRDLETAEIAVSAALTGHLVLSTLHTNDAAGAISRLVNIGVPPFLVGSALTATVAQRLIRVSCLKCRKPVRTLTRDLSLLGYKAPALQKGKGPKLYKGSGCNDCHQTGYKGRKSIYEVLPVSSAIRSLILRGEDNDVIIQQAVFGIHGVNEGLDIAVAESKGLKFPRIVAMTRHMVGTEGTG